MTTPKAKAKEKRRFGVWWVCPNCPGEPEFEHKAMIAHIGEVHEIPPKTQGSKRALMHLDGDTWFSWTYEWTLNGLKFVQFSCQKRSKEDAAYWMP